VCSKCSRITGLTFYNTVNADRYMNNILCPFFSDLTDEERLHNVFQHDTATAHKAYASLEALCAVLGDCTIKCKLWPLRLLFVKNFKRTSVATKSPHSGRTKNNIHYKISAAYGKELQKVKTNVFCRHT
jgi:hypothetical protein